MSFKRLSSNSEELLLKLVDADNPTELLCGFFKDVCRKRDEELRGIIYELVQHGYIRVMWASNLPFRVVLSNSARMYREQSSDTQRSRGMEIAVGNEKTIFISHRSADKDVADMVMTFLV